MKAENIEKVKEAFMDEFHIDFEENYCPNCGADKREDKNG